MRLLTAVSQVRVLFGEPFLKIIRYYLFILLGKYSEGGTPGHIPNPEVKPFSAENTMWVTAWKNRTLPSIFLFLEKLNIKNSIYFEIDF